MLPKLTNVWTMLQKTLPIANMEAITSLKETKPNLQRDFTMLDQFRLLSKSLLDSKTTKVVYTLQKAVDTNKKMSIMQFWQLDTELKKVWSSGILKTHGEPAGERMDISKLKEMWTCVQLLNVILTLSLTVPMIS